MLRTLPAASQKFASTLLDNRPVFDASIPGFSEAYYLIWSDPSAQRTMVIRYVLVNGAESASRFAEVWCWYRDRVVGDDLAIRQRYPLDSVRIGSQGLDLRIGAVCGLSEERAWGQVEGLGRTFSWDLTIHSESVRPVDRLRGAAASVLFPRFYSNGCRCLVDVELRLDDRKVTMKNVSATDGHYWNTHHLQTWSWASGVRFHNAPDAFLEAIAFRLHNDKAPIAVSLVFGDGRWVWQNEMLEALYLNRELESTLERWVIAGEFGMRRVECEVTGDPDDMILITHPLPDGSYLYTTITLNARIRLDIADREGEVEPTALRLESDGGASFEVTKPERHPRVWREFKVLPAPMRWVDPIGGRGE